MVRLPCALRHFDVISTVGGDCGATRRLRSNSEIATATLVIQDAPASVSDLYESLEMVSNTTKPLVILVSDENNFPSVLDMLEGLHGDLAGPGGNFLLAETTRRLFRKAYYPSPIFPRWSLEKWQAQGRPPAIDLLRQYTLHLLETLQPPVDHDDLMAKGEAFIRAM